MRLNRGATYKIPVRILLKKQPLSFDNIQKIEFSFNGEIIKTYPDDKSITRKEDKLIIFLSSKDTLALTTTIDKPAKLQARLVFTDEDIKFTDLKSYIVSDTQFKEVIVSDTM